MLFCLCGVIGDEIMIKFREDFNCCKTVGCKNFGVVNSPDYIYKSRRLGYLSIECKVCGSNPPWINNALTNNVLREKVEFQFGRKLTDCPKCYKYFFMTETGSKPSAPNSPQLKYQFGFTGCQNPLCNFPRSIPCPMYQPQ